MKLGGTQYRVSLTDLLKAKKYKVWLKGPIVNEFIVSSSLKAVRGGALHPHLAARFAVRSYKGLKRTKIDVIMENGWTYEPNPQDFTYDIDVEVDGRNVYSKDALTHYNHARFRKSFYQGEAPLVHIKHNTPYLISTKAVPNYDQSLQFTDKILNDLKARFDKSKKEPMGNGLAAAAMGTTGGRPDIGINPSWNATLILTLDKRAKEVALGMGDLAGSWGTHFRVKATDEPVSLIDYPHMTAIRGTGVAFNKAKNRSEELPKCVNACANKNSADVSHQPAFAYVPYLLTGDHYYMEELMFYGMWNVFKQNPGSAYRNYASGHLKREQVRGQAWSLRTFADGAFILPDSERLKAHFEQILASNLQWYNENYSHNPSANKFGTINNCYSLVYNSKRGLAPWQDDFFTSAIGRAVEYEIPGAVDLLRFKAKFAVGRMANPEFCWVLGATYTMSFRDSETSPLYTTFKEVYEASNAPSVTSTKCGSSEMATAIGAKGPGVMTGYPTATAGYPANFQPAAAYAADSGITNGLKAWKVFDNRSLKPNYATDPQFAIIPRTK